MLLLYVPRFPLPSFHYSYNNVIFIIRLDFLYSSCSYFLELIIKSQCKFSSPPERLGEGAVVFHFSEPLPCNNCLKVNSSKLSRKPFCLFFTLIEMIYMELEVETLISFSMFNFIVKTGPPLEGRGFSLLTAVYIKWALLLLEIKLSIILENCSAILRSLNSTLP